MADDRNARRRRVCNVRRRGCVTRNARGGIKEAGYDKNNVVEKQIDAEGKLAVNKKNINVAIDTSLFAEERWEQNFPHNAKNETLFAYIERMKAAGTIENKAYILSNLKALYCFMEGSDIVLSTFRPCRRRIP